MSNPSKVVLVVVVIVVAQLGLKLNTKLGLDHPPPTTTNFSTGSRLGRRLRLYM